MAFKSQKEYRSVTRKPNASSNGNKKKGVEPTSKVSNSNPFDVLNSVDNDVEFGTKGGNTNLVNNEATSSGSSFMNIDNDGFDETKEQKNETRRTYLKKDLMIGKLQRCNLMKDLMIGKLQICNLMMDLMIINSINVFD
ncbi:hypothetical protein Tco_0028442 [Tanacetum coccineum]